MSGFVNRLKSWVTGDDFEDELYQIDDAYEMDGAMMRYEQQPTMAGMDKMTDTMMDKPRRKNLRVVDNAAAGNQVIVIEPRGFEESLEIVEHLRARKSVILNLHLLDTAQSQRIVDFLSGATHAIDGNQQRIGDGVFIFTPSHVSIATEQAKAASTLNTADAIWTRA